MKKLSCFLLLLSFVLTPLLFPCTIFAQENIRSKESSVLRNTEVINNDYFAAGERVTLSGIVNGDAYLAGGKVFVDGTVNGDLLIAGGTATIRGKILHNLRIVGGNITIDSTDIGGNVTVASGNVLFSNAAKIAGSLVAASGNTEVYAPIGKGITFAGGNVILGNTVNGNIVGAVGSLDILPGARINGNVDYWSQDNAKIAKEASISGKILAHLTPKGTQETAERGKAFISGFTKTIRIVSLISSIIIGLLLLYLVPIFMESTVETILKQPGKNFLIGLIAMFAFPLLAVILFATIIGIPLSVLILMAFFVLMYIGKIVVMFTVGQKVLGYTDYKLSNTWTFLVGAIVFFLLTWIPFIGTLIGIIGALIGFGSVLAAKANYYQLLRNKKLI